MNNISNNNLFLNKYKPLYFDDFQNNTDLNYLLKSLIEIDNLNILFIGNIGCGKTTYINTLIREYYRSHNYQNYKDNILEINSLKDQGINFYRNDVKIFNQTCSLIKNKKKLVILDDIDTINEQSQQVFRNYIDKYSHNVNFIASCTNSQKVIDSLQSRFIIIKIKQPTKDNLKLILNKIKINENIIMDTNVEDYIINLCNNNIKLLINYLEKIKLLEQKITLEDAHKICTNIDYTLFNNYISFIKEGSLNNAVKILYDIFDKGYSVIDILDNFFLYIKFTSLLHEQHKYEIISYICKYIIIFHNIHEHEIELALLTNNLFKLFNK
jgi:DNA polymerase III delta prime subunit